MANELVPPDAEHPRVLHGLLRKRAEIVDKIEENQLDRRKLLADLAHVDGAICLFSPDIDLGAIKAKTIRFGNWSPKGAVTRPLYDALREAKGPLTANAIAMKIITAKGLDVEDPEVLRSMFKRVRFCLRDQRNRGFVRNTAVVGDEQLLEWVLVR